MIINTFTSFANISFANILITITILITTHYYYLHLPFILEGHMCHKPQIHMHNVLPGELIVLTSWTILSVTKVFLLISVVVLAWLGHFFSLHLPRICIFSGDMRRPEVPDMWKRGDYLHMKQAQEALKHPLAGTYNVPCWWSPCTNSTGMGLWSVHQQLSWESLHQQLSWECPTASYHQRV